MPADEYQALVDSIGNIGVQNPITVYDNMVIDGWHRYTAAHEAGMDCPVIELGDVDPKDFVIAQNRHRRHITIAQLAMAATAVFSWADKKNNLMNQGSARNAVTAYREPTQKEIAQKTGVSVGDLSRAAGVAKTAPIVAKAVVDGKIGIDKAVAISKLPESEQAAAIDKPMPKAKPKAAAKPKATQKPAEKPAASEDPDAPPDYTDLDAARDQIADLQADLVIARMGNVSEEDRLQAAELIADLREDNRLMALNLKQITISRDSLMSEKAQMIRQMAAQRKEIAKLNARALDHA